MPLLAVHMPVNAKVVFLPMIDILNFDVFPSDDIDSKVFNL